jgi:hypothetical protein
MLSQAKEKTMIQLTDTQLIILSKAAARDDGAATVPANLNKASAAMVGSSLVARNLMQEFVAERGMPVWRENDQGERISLVITSAGREAIGVVDEGGAFEAHPLEASSDPAEDELPRADDEQEPPVLSPRAGSKQALVIDLLSQDTGPRLTLWSQRPVGSRIRRGQPSPACASAASSSNASAMTSEELFIGLRAIQQPRGTDPWRGLLHPNGGRRHRGPRVISTQNWLASRRWARASFGTPGDASAAATRQRLCPRT